jgi:5-methylcytosine-specific restriction endonuclease McrA
MEPFSAVSQQIRKREKAKAREIRNSAWWKNQVGCGVCYYCKQNVPPSELTMDHKTPVARGGRSTRNNLVPCCKACNSDKNLLTFSEWIAKREREGHPLPCARDELY